MADQNNIHPALLKKSSEVMERVKSWNDVPFFVFGIQTETDNPLYPAIKVYLKSDHETYFFIQPSDEKYDISFSPTDDPFVKVSKIPIKLAMRAGADPWQMVLGTLDGWKNILLEHKKERERYQNLETEFGASFENFINDSYWNSKEPIEEEKKILFINQINEVINHIESIPEDQAPQAAKNYLIAELELIKSFIKDNKSRAFIKEQLNAFGYAIFWDLLINQHSRSAIIGAFIGLGKLILGLPA